MVTIRNNSIELEDGDTISVDGTELTFRSSGELEFPDGETAISLSDIDGADIAPDSVTATTEITSPSVIADALEASNEFVPPVVATEADLPDPANVPEGAETTVLSDPNGETSVYKVVDS